MNFCTTDRMEKDAYEDRKKDGSETVTDHLA
jgi:hypothetical protein